MSASLVGPLAKLDWAEKHLTKLDAEIQAFYAGSVEEGKPYEVRSEFRPNTSEYVFWIEVLRQPPVDFGLILGDFVHNLRAALDHLICQLARLANPKSTCARTQFPIAQSHARFQQLAPDHLKHVSDIHRAAVESMQPYHSGTQAADHFLSVLARLDNVDKHRLVHPTFGFFSDRSRGPRPNLRFEPNRDAGVIRYTRMANGRRIKQRQTDIVWVKLAPVGTNPKVKMYGDLLFEPAFGDAWMAAKVLPQLLNTTRQLVQDFAAEFP